MVISLLTNVKLGKKSSFASLSDLQLKKKKKSYMKCHCSLIAFLDINLSAPLTPQSYHSTY